MAILTFEGKTLTDRKITEISHLIIDTIKRTIADGQDEGEMEALISYMAPEQIREYTQQAYCVVYEEDNAIIGFGYLDHRNERWEIKSMYVSKSRNGIGTQILTKLELEARRKNVQTLYLESLENNSAISFYRKNGYSPIKPHDYAGGLHCTIMCKQLE